MLPHLLLFRDCSSALNVAFVLYDILLRYCPDDPVDLMFKS